MTDMAQVARDFERAADVMEERGSCTSVHMEKDGSVCLFGAVGVAREMAFTSAGSRDGSLVIDEPVVYPDGHISYSVIPPSFGVYERVLRNVIGSMGGVGTWTWSDTAERKHEERIEALRRASKLAWEVAV